MSVGTPAPFTLRRDLLMGHEPDTSLVPNSFQAIIKVALCSVSLAVVNTIACAINAQSGQTSVLICCCREHIFIRPLEPNCRPSAIVLRSPTSCSATYQPAARPATAYSP